MSAKSARAKHRKQARQHASAIDLLVSGGNTETELYRLHAKSAAGVEFLRCQTGEKVVEAAHPAQVVSLALLARRHGLIVEVA